MSDPVLERPLRIPENVPLMQADPAFAIASEMGTWRLPFRLTRDLNGSEPLRLQVMGGRNNWGTFPNLQTAQADAEGFVTARLEDGTPLALNNLALASKQLQAGTFAVQVPADGLKAGSVLTVTLGDRSGGSAGIRAPTLCQRNKFFLLYVHDPLAPREGLSWSEANGRQIIGACLLRILGAAADHLYVYAPSQVRPGEPFRVTVRPQDRFGNLSSAPLTALTVRDNGADLACRATPAPDSTAAHLQVAVMTEGIHRLTVRDGASGLEAVSNPIVCSNARGPWNIYWGMIHGHSEMSDGVGSLDSYFRQLRDECALDFGAPGDHDHLYETSDAFWKITCAKVKQYHDPGRFVTFLGYEFAKWRRKGEGDRNVYYLEDDRPMYRSDEGHYPWPNDLFRAVQNETCLIVPHHTARAASYCDWEDHDPLHERLVEIFQILGSQECAAEDDQPVPDRAGGELPNPAGYVRRALAMGWRVGFTAGGDDHSGTAGSDVVPSGHSRYYKAGNMCVFAAQRTRAALWDALWNRRVVATTGPRVILWYTLSGRPMGAEIDVKTAPELLNERAIEIEYHGMAAVKRIDIVRNGAVIHSAAGGEPDMRLAWRDTEPLARTLLPPAKYCDHPFAYYYVRVTQVDGAVAWASPVWLDSPRGENEKTRS